MIIGGTEDMEGTAQTQMSSQIDAGQLAERLMAGERPFVLDVRNRDEYERWRLEGREGPLQSLNVPYFDMFDYLEGDDLVGALVTYAERHLIDRLPRDEEILVVCAKGDTSDLVAQALRRLGFRAINLAGGMVAFGNYYRLALVESGEELTVIQGQRIARGCLSYVLISRGEAVVVDPGRHIRPYLRVLQERGAKLIAVLDTHAHADHISGGPELAGRLGVPYLLHPYDGIHPIDMLPAETEFDYLREDDSITFGQSYLRVLHVPGHTLGNTALLVDDRFLLTGDTIFIDSVARPDLGGQGERWAPIHYRSLRRLAGLPPETVVLPGHFSKLAEADEWGIFRRELGRLVRENEGLVKLRDGEEAYTRYLLSSLPEFPEQYVEIKRVNAGLVRPDEEKAQELELGKNICALAEAYQTAAGNGKSAGGEGDE